jgi:hypothetical protein
MRSPNTTPLLADLRVQAVKESREEREEKTEQYSVLEGLRKYAANHVLLVGRPGSGKSTAFARLLLEESEKARDLLVDYPHQKKIVQIPILVELRYYETSIIDLILQFLKRHDLIINGSELEIILLGNADIHLLLLFDGVNELPSEKGRLDLQRFRNSYEKVSMIFSTRDIGIGGDLNLEKKFEMLPLTEPKMKNFVRAYLPENGEKMLKQLGNRLREFGQTPLLLWMLCSVFEDNNSQIPNNLGLVFHQFTKIYDHKLKADFLTFEESRDWWRALLQVLAWKMMEGESKTELKVAISRREAELELTTFVLDQGFPKHYSKKWLDDLLKHHLIQLEGNDQITFRHQLIQEYYASEALLDKISESELSDEELQWNYLNYLKWTEPFALMLGMIKNKDKAIHIVKLALAVDVKLGSRLAGEVKIDFQKKTVKLVSDINVPKLFKIDLLGMTRSEEAIDELVKNLEDENKDICRASISSLCQIKTKRTIKGLLIALKSSDWLVRCNAADALGQIGTSSEIAELQKAFKCSHWKVRFHVERALQELGVDVSIEEEFNIKENYDFSDEYDEYYILDNYDDSWVWCEPSSISQKGSDRSIPHLLESLKSHSFLTRKDAAFFLGEIGSEEIVPDLIISLKDSDSFVCGTATEALINIGKQNTLVNLFKILKNPTFIHANNGSAFYYAYSVITAIQNKLKYYQPKPKIMNQKVYISYNWEEDSNKIADQIVQAFKARGIEVIQDKEDMHYKDSIEKFMEEIGQAQCVITVISDRYLKSRNCMLELVGIAKVGDFDKRIIPIVLKDARIYKAIERLNYIHYWETEIKELENAMKLGGLSKLEGITQELDLYTEIRNCIASLTDTLKDMNTLNIDLHCESGFTEMIQAVEAKLAEDSQNSSVSPSHNPTSSSQSITYDLRGANVGNLAHNVQGNQHTNQQEKP